MPSTGAYLIVGAAAALITFITTPIVALVARRVGWMAEPNERTVHTRPIPDVGGIALFLGFVGAFAL
ncbi:MAG: undecaprenyl/decaprenyl-phosphate alpha-N-acetylglucosaminyl 1-phosphate transferase, partial [Actinobacteria bacterium]|nr:undecaprenyl/decaprenyl-phosphate alpha-N-acetylglucosaminyl 1-phosphate transferase [Actinomycetota bacterium]